MTYQEIADRHDALAEKITRDEVEDYEQAMQELCILELAWFNHPDRPDPDVIEIGGEVHEEPTP